MGLSLTLNLAPVRFCRKKKHKVPRDCKRCPFCDRAQHAAWYEKRADLVKEYNKKYNAQVHMREYRRKKTAEYREQESVRLAHNTQERQRRLDKRYMFVRTTRKYGLEVYDFAWLLHSQDFKCCGCLEFLVIDKRTHIDHCHTTDKVRGILCYHCNLVLGQARDNAETLKRLAAYLERT